MLGISKQISEFNKLLDKTKTLYRIVFNIHYSPNNTIASVCDRLGHVLYRESAGTCGFHSSERDSYIASSELGNTIGKIVLKSPFNDDDVLLRVRGNSYHKKVFIETLTSFIEFQRTLKSVVDTSPIPHNGCRVSKRRRKN